MEDFVSQLTAVARQVNAFAASLKSQRPAAPSAKTLKELGGPYRTDAVDEYSEIIFTETDFEWLQGFPISNL